MSSRNNNSLPGAILLAHGSREPEATTEMQELCGALSASWPGWHFTAAFLNQPPGLEQAVESLLSEGCRSVCILPLFVFKGRHTLEDIPNQVAVLSSKHPGLAIDLGPHLSRLPGFRDLILQTLQYTISQSHEA